MHGLSGGRWPASAQPVRHLRPDSGGTTGRMDISLSDFKRSASVAIFAGTLVSVVLFLGVLFDAKCLLILASGCGFFRLYAGTRRSYGYEVRLCHNCSPDQCGNLFGPPLWCAARQVQKSIVLSAVYL